MPVVTLKPKHYNTLGCMSAMANVNVNIITIPGPNEQVFRYLVHMCALSFISVCSGMKMSASCNNLEKSEIYLHNLKLF